MKKRCLRGFSLALALLLSVSVLQLQPERAAAMRILAIDASSPVVSLAVCENDRPLTPVVMKKVTMVDSESR